MADAVTAGQSLQAVAAQIRKGTLAGSLPLQSLMCRRCVLQLRCVCTLRPGRWEGVEARHSAQWRALSLVPCPCRTTAEALKGPTSITPICSTTLSGRCAPSPVCVSDTGHDFAASKSALHARVHLVMNFFRLHGTKTAVSLPAVSCCNFSSAATYVPGGVPGAVQPFSSSVGGTGVGYGGSRPKAERYRSNADA